MDTVERIKQLQEKKQKADLASAKLKGQIEGLRTQREELEESLKEKFGLTFDEVAEHVSKLEQEQEDKLVEAEKLFDKINL